MSNTPRNTSPDNQSANESSPNREINSGASERPRGRHARITPDDAQRNTSSEGANRVAAARNAYRSAVADGASRTAAVQNTNRDTAARSAGQNAAMQGVNRDAARSASRNAAVAGASHDAVAQNANRGAAAAGMGATAQQASSAKTATMQPAQTATITPAIKPAAATSGQVPALDADPRAQARMQSYEQVAAKKVKKRKMPLPAKILIVLILIVLAAGIGIFAALHFNNASMSAKIQDINNNSNVTVGESSNNGQRITYKGETYELNQNVVSCLVIGHDDDAESDGKLSQADMIAVFAIDTSTGKITMIGIPRDSMVTVDRYGVDADGNRAGYVGQVTEQICLAYNYGKGQDAIDNVKVAVERLLYNVPITYTFDLYENGIVDINDALDGVTLTPLESIPNTGIVEGEEITLLGQNAKKYVQYRDTKVDGSSLSRQARQTQYIKAFMETILERATDSITVIPTIYGIASNYVTTDLGVDATVYLAQCAIANKIDFQTKTLTGTMTLNTNTGYNEYNLDKDVTMQTVIDTYYKKVS